ncbi:MAG: DUF2231 domain-containing protein [Gemmatimonadota bacterium]
MRLQELHPALVHFPIALLPTALAADALGRLSGSETLMETGRRIMPAAAASAAAAGVAGLISQQASEVPEGAHPYLVTHRNVNLGVIGLTALLARKRARCRRPGVGYLLAGLGTLATVAYTAYLGGHMVYEHGVGVKPAGGLKEGKAPEMRLDNADEVLQTAARHVREGWHHTVEHLARSEIAPVLTRRSTPRSGKSSGRSQGAPPDETPGSGVRPE